ncbi:MAG: dihydrodipicolinate synthase family protein [Candidatus Aminicenantes bacterium]|nr:dihydrodipicolinate synthase family protein [Candidatus Aminicenantes bacterium]
MHLNFNGVFAALTTPFIEDRISPEKLRENIKKYNRFQLSGYVVLGSTGESVYLTDEESEKLVEAAKESASKEKKIIVGTARESTKATLEFTNRMAGLGIDAALVRTPSYFKSLMSQEALKRHYLTIAEQAKVPVLIYNIPRNTGISVDSNLIIELSQHDNIAGIKDSSGNLSFLGEFLPRISPKFHVLLGAGSVFLEGLLLGAKGGILALAAVVPGLCVKLYELFSEKNLEEALRLQLQLIPLNKAIIQTYGIPGIKYALDLLGYNGGSPRLPLLPLDEKGKEEIKTLLDELGLL